MVEKIESFRASDGTIHDNPHNAWRAELTAWFMSGGDVTQASATALVSRIARLDEKGRISLVAMITELIETAPPPVEPAQ